MRISPGGRVRRLAAGALLGALLTSVGLVAVTHLWDQPLHVPFQYAQVPGDDQQDATLDMMLVKNIAEQGWFATNPALNAPFAQHWAEWPMGGDLVAYTIKKAIVDVTGDVPLTLNLFWLLTFPLVALVAVPALRALRCSPSTAVVGGVLFALAPYHFRNGTGHSNLAFYVGVPVIVIACVRMLGPPGVAADARRSSAPAPAGGRSAGCCSARVLVAVTGIYYLAFLLTLVAHVRADRRGRAPPARAGSRSRRSIGGVGLVTAVLANLPTILFRCAAPGEPARRPRPAARGQRGLPAPARGAAEPGRRPPLRRRSPGSSDQLSAGRAQRPGHRQPRARGGDRLRHRRRRARARAARAPRARRLAARVPPRHRDADRVLLRRRPAASSRVMELLGLQGVRAWNRIAIVIAFAAIAVFARTLDRVRVSRRCASRFRRNRSRGTPVLAVVLVVGLLDQTSGAVLPDPRANERGLARRRRRSCTASSGGSRTARRCSSSRSPTSPSTAPATACRTTTSSRRRTSTPRRCAGVRAASAAGRPSGSGRRRDLKLRNLLRGLVAMGFTGVMLDRSGYARRRPPPGARASGTGSGPPSTAADHRLLAWDLRRASPALLAGLDAPARARLRRRMLVAPAPLPRRRREPDDRPRRSASRVPGRHAPAREPRPPSGAPSSSCSTSQRGHSDATGGTVRARRPAGPAPRSTSHTPRAASGSARDHDARRSSCATRGSAATTSSTTTCRRSPRTWSPRLTREPPTARLRRSASARGDRRRDERPRPVPLGREREVEQQRVGVVAGEHLDPDRQPVDRPRGDRHRRVAVEVRRDRERAHVHEVGEPLARRGEERRRELREHPGQRRGRRTARRAARAAPARVDSTQSATPDCGALVTASAANAGPGLVAAMTKSTCSNAAAIASFAWIRSASAAAAVLRL